MLSCRSFLDLFQEVMEPFHYINQVPGKDFRGKLIDAFQVRYSNLHRVAWAVRFTWYHMSRTHESVSHSFALFTARACSGTQAEQNRILQQH